MFCRNTLIDKLIQECTSVVLADKNYNETLNTIYSDDCASCTIYVVLLVLFLTASAITGSSFNYFCWYKKDKQLDLKKSNVSKVGLILVLLTH